MNIKRLIKEFLFGFVYGLLWSILMYGTLGIIYMIKRRWER